MGERITLLLLIAVAATGYLLWNGKQSEPAVPAADQVVSLLEFDPAKIDSVALSYRGRSATFEKKGERWTGPPGTDVTELIRQIRELKVILVLEATSGTWADFGLDPAVGRIELETADKLVVALRIGNRNPAATGVYVLRESDQRAFLTGAAVLWPLEALLTRAG